MQIEWILPAIKAVVRPTGTTDIRGAGVDTLLTAHEALPGKVGFMLACRVAGPMSDWSEAGHSMRVEVLDSRGNRLEVIREPLREIEPPPHLQAAAEPGRLIALPVLWRASGPGRFLVRVFLDEHLQREYAMTVATGEEE